MPGESYEFKDMNKMSSLNSLSEGHRGGGCYVSIVKGFILALLAILIAVVIGLIVHFAGAARTIECNCPYPTEPINPGVSGKQTGAPPTTVDPDIAKCERLASEGNARICNACLSSVTTTTASPSTPEEKVDVRLPTALLPQRYDVKLRPNMYGPDPKEFNFTGSVKIWMKCEQSTDNITLHINEITIIEESIQVYGGGKNFSATVERDERRQFLILKLNENLNTGGSYYVSMDYYGPLKDGLNGLYLSSYQRGNETVYLATTQFQATDARKAFPCFDEPAIKAVFDITLERKRTKTALSNMPVYDTQNLEDDWVADHFMATPKMSTYLLAFIVCDFEFTENTTIRNVKYRAYARPEAKNQTEYGLKVGVEVLTYFEDYFNITYPLPKQDMIALPDFSAGAMENWGLITYRETAMLYDPAESSEGNKQRVAIVVAHELAHQWFGDLVTPSWWDDIWLNEGFASYMEYTGVEHVEKDWKLDEQFVINDLQAAMSFDGLISSHPLFVPVADPDEINEVFDSISYLKGSSIIRMAKFFMGEETFKNGLTNYLRGLEYGAAAHNDLWYAWGNQSVTDGKVRTDVKEIMDTWVLQMNYPVVNVRRTETGINLEQERFLLDPTAPDPGKYTSPFGYVWDIPITYTHEDEKDFSASRIIWMTGKNADLVNGALPKSSDDKWVLLNINQYGYYRVNYDERNWRQIIRQLENNHTVIPTINRAQILNDAWNLARAGLLDMAIALNTTNYLINERDYIPWQAALSQLGFVDTMLQRNSLYGAFSKFMSDTVRDYFNELTMNNAGADHITSYRRSQISAEACEYGVQSCINQSKTLFRQWMNDETNNPIDPGLRYTVYCTAIRNGGVEEWDFAYEQHKISNVAGELSKLRSAMACSRETWILNRYLQRAIMPGEIRKQDAVSVITTISRSPVGRGLVWDFVRANWSYLKSEYGDGSFSFARLISGITSAFNTEFDTKQLEEFKAAYPDMGSGTRAFDQALERTKSNIKWMDANIPVIDMWLRAKNL